MTDRQTRRTLSMDAKLVIAKGEVLNIRIIDFSSQGCKIATPKFLWVGDKVGLSLPGYTTLNSEVRWSRQGHAGLEFDEHEGDHQLQIPRTGERIPVETEITLRRLGGSNYRVALYDLSLEGCRVDLVERMAVGEILHLRLPGLATVEAKVRWVEGFVAGLTFATPFHPAVFNMLMDRIGSSKN